MNKPALAFACAGIMVGTILGAGCGGDGSSGVDSTSLTTQATATTSTAAPTSTLPGQTTTSGPPTTIAVVPTVAVTAPPADPALTTPPTAEPSETTAAVDTTAAPETTVAPRSSDEFTPVASPTVPASTQPVTEGSNADGVYFGTAGATGVASAAGGGGGGSVRFILTQLFTGEACVAHFGAADEDACLNDYGVEAVPSAIVEVTLDRQFISVVDAASQQSYQVSGGELYEMLLGGTPAPTAPAGYTYSPFGFLITFEGGAATRLEQWWTP